MLHINTGKALQYSGCAPSTPVNTYPRKAINPENIVEIPPINMVTTPINIGNRFENHSFLIINSKQLKIQTNNIAKIIFMISSQYLFLLPYFFTFGSIKIGIYLAHIIKIQLTNI